MNSLLERRLYGGGVNGGALITSGPSAVKAAEAARKLDDQRNAWPYTHVYPPPMSQRRNPTGYIVAPAVSATPVLVFSYQVPSGSQFELTRVMFAAVTTGYVPVGNPGDYLFTINRNTPATGISPQGSPLADLQLVPFPFGSPTQGPVELSRSENFQANDIVSLYVTNVSGNVGNPNFIVGMLQGWQRKV